jgi:hypothetical protein
MKPLPLHMQSSQARNTTTLIKREALKQNTLGTCSFLFHWLPLAILRDIGTHWSPPTRVLEVPVKWTRPVRSPTDLQVDPETLSATPMTLEDPRATLSRSRRTRRARGARLSPRSRLDAASRFADHGIHPVITEDDLPNL